MAIILLGAVFGLFYYLQFLKPFITQPNQVPVQNSGDFLKFKSFSLDYDLFSKASFKNLRMFGEAPVNPGTPGKNNPFTP
ncbi:MAG: hypothetical protein CEN90_255 [Parcubacteria group bacterium Licking1014_17]|nr:MAG: hypothetical protein CEN90_255 [Parcubacteria group bacterium Licking1014_17]